MSHRTASLALREQFAVDDPRPLLEKLRRGGDIDEAVLLSTCNRVELCAVGSSRDAAALRLARFFERELAEDVDPGELEAALYRYEGEDAALHVFRVASSIDSMVIGEPQILGQVKDAYRTSADAAACGAVLSRLYQMAFGAAKRVRNETRIAERPVSVAGVAVELALGVFEQLDDKAALLVGAGDMTELALEALRGAGLSKIRVANRTPARAAQLASRFAASAHGLDELPQLLERSDVVLTSIAGRAPLFRRDDVARAVAARRGRPLFVVDIGVPRNVAPEVDALENVFRYDIDDLAAVAERNADGRRAESQLAEQIVGQEVTRFQDWLAAKGSVPAIQALRRRAEFLRRAELDRFASKLAATPDQREHIEALTRGLVNKLLHEPLSQLRAGGEDADEVSLAARRLFALDEVPGSDDEFEPE
jgi:glutamyl-tRNA reductase